MFLVTAKDIWDAVRQTYSKVKDADILTKGVQNPVFKNTLDKLGMKDLFHPA